jgi:hypothetical protein
MKKKREGESTGPDANFTSYMSNLTGKSTTEEINARQG